MSMEDANNNKKENFKRISENRVNKILGLLQQLTNLTNTSFYSYSNDDVEKIFNAIEEETAKTKSKLLDANRKDKTKKRFTL